MRETDAVKMLEAKGYRVTPPVTPEDKVIAAAGDFAFHAQRLRDLVREGALIPNEAEVLIRIAADAIHEARTRGEMRTAA